MRRAVGPLMEITVLPLALAHGMEYETGYTSRIIQKFVTGQFIRKALPPENAIGYNVEYLIISH